MGFISFASLVSRYASLEFCVKKGPKVPRDKLMANMQCLPGFRMGKQHLVCQSLTLED